VGDGGGRVAGRCGQMRKPEQCVLAAIAKCESLAAFGSVRARTYLSDDGCEGWNYGRSGDVLLVLPAVMPASLAHPHRSTLSLREAQLCHG
jgi:hypothetical protein